MLTLQKTLVGGLGAPDGRALFPHCSGHSIRHFNVSTLHVNVRWHAEDKPHLPQECQGKVTSDGEGLRRRVPKMGRWEPDLKGILGLVVGGEEEE